MSLPPESSQSSSFPPPYPPFIPVITVDGPGGVGKGTLSIALAQHLGWHFLDSGAFYRLLALAAIQLRLNFADETRLQALATQMVIEFKGDNVLLDGQDVTSSIRSEACGRLASQIAVFPLVRAAILVRTRAFKALPGLVADGRDMGTVVFPEAFLKVFLTASPETRAKRRYYQLKEAGYSVNLQSLLAEIEARDKRDQERAIAPLKQAEDAVVIDTTDLGREVVFDQVLAEAKRRLSSV